MSQIPSGFPDNSPVIRFSGTIHGAGWMFVSGFCGLIACVPLEGATTALPSTPVGFSSAPAAPSGFYSSPVMPASNSGVGGQILDGLTMVTTLGMTYDSNITQSPGMPVAPVEDDVFLIFGGSLNYRSKASELTFGGDYHGSYNQYFDHTEYSGFSQGADLSANYDLGNLSVAGVFGVNYNHGANRNYGSELVDQTTFNSSLSARYRLSPKTSLAGNLSQSLSTSSGDFNETQSYDLGASALWKYSPLTELGPGVRYTYRSDGTGDGRNSIGPTLSVNYKLSTKVSLNSRVGVDFATYEDGASADPTLSASMAIDYRASKLWGMSFSLYRDTQADPSVSGGYYEVTALRLGYNRKIQRANLNLGINYETTSYSIPAFTGVVSGSTPIPTAAPDRDYFSIDGSLGMRVLGNTSYASIFMRYNDQSGGGINSWDAVQTGVSIGRAF